MFALLIQCIMKQHRVIKGITFQIGQNSTTKLPRDPAYTDACAASISVG